MPTISPVAPPTNVRAIACSYFGVLAPHASLGDAATLAVQQDPGMVGALAGLGGLALAQLVPILGYALDQRAEALMDRGCRVEPAASVLYETLLQVSGEPPSSEVVQILIDMFGKIEATPIAGAAADILIALAEYGLDVAIAANVIMPGDYVRARCAEAGLQTCVKTLIASSEWGWCKPHPSLFRELLHALGRTAEETLFVGTQFQEDIRGAEAVGMRTVWFQPENRERVQQVQQSYVVNDLGVLLDWFGGSE